MSTNTNIKPVVLLPGPGVTRYHAQAAISGIQEMLSFAEIDNIDDVMPIIDLGEREDIAAYRSIGDHIDHALVFSQRPKQLAAEALMAKLFEESLRVSPSHYLVVIISEDMYSNENAGQFVVAVNKPHFAIIVSRYRFAELNEVIMFEMLKYTVMHNLGHLFGLPFKNGYGYSKSEEHCLNEWCLMRQGMNLDQWQQHAFDRMAALTLCPQCKEAFRYFFRS